MMYRGYECRICEKTVSEPQMGIRGVCRGCQPKLERDISQGLFQDTKPCEECSGKGQVEWPPYSEKFHDCHICDATGIVEAQSKAAKSALSAAVLVLESGLEG